MRKLQRVLKWIVEHIYYRSVDQNHGEGKPHITHEIGIKGEF